MCEKTSETSAGQRSLGWYLAPRAAGQGAQLIAGDCRKANGLRCVRPSTLRRAVSKWLLDMHTPMGCICMRPFTLRRAVSKWPLITRQWVACMRPFQLCRAVSKWPLDMHAHAAAPLQEPLPLCFVGIDTCACTGTQSLFTSPSKSSSYFSFFLQQLASYLLTYFSSSSTESGFPEFVSEHVAFSSVSEGSAAAAHAPCVPLPHYFIHQNPQIVLTIVCRE